MEKDYLDVLRGLRKQIQKTVDIKGIPWTLLGSHKENIGSLIVDYSLF